MNALEVSVSLRRLPAAMVVCYQRLEGTFNFTGIFTKGDSIIVLFLVYKISHILIHSV